MVVVAIAGGSSPTLGRSITTAILATGKHEVIILSRTPSNPSATTSTAAHGAPIAYVDYDSVASISDALNKHKVHTLISVLKPITTDPVATHITLLRACQSTPTCTRFAASDWSLGPLSHSNVDLLAHKSSMLSQCTDLASQHFQSTGHKIEVCTFHNGGFLNYLFQNAPFHSSTQKQQALEGLEDDLMLEYINPASGKFNIPTTPSGNPARTTLTDINDIGLYIASLISVPVGTPHAWNGAVGIEGVTTTYVAIRDILEQD